MRIAVTALVVCLSVLCFADSMDKLSHALLRDRSFRVRIQAAIIIGKLKDPRGVQPLIKALSDKEAAVRAVAASSLGKLRDPVALEALAGLMNDPSTLVRSAVGKALGTIEGSPDEDPTIVEPPQPMNGPRRFGIEISPVAANKGGPDMAKHVQTELEAQLGKLSEITLSPEPEMPRYFVDLSITKINSGPAETKGNVKVDCELSVIIATNPGHAMKAMTTVWTSVEEQGGASRGIGAAQNFCLGETAKMASEKVQSFLKGVR